ncbi:hypothetical protein CANARDRAFT_237663 [[Candida] arabinofermentans NRRL YB-2248]|uniref:protein-tyrosine-phosphatase n=1 Tax=[Candida] arabinofermentans NRRL YB-2248 TaxID=983967 RepID=A0A1E4SWF8_9ASCO|nr:hypothetical protein CANARDRAFT_237663 [[Candida] arabinofermentans NRRL YB-2248]
MAESFRYIENWRGIVGEDGLPNLLVIDVRPFQDYCKSHIVGAVNLCLPSTLLKRSTFTLDRCIATLTSEEKALFTKYLQRDMDNLPTLIFYDSCTESSDTASLSISNLSSKFVNTQTWKAPLYVMQGGFKEFELLHPAHVETGSHASMPKVMVAPCRETPSSDQPPKIQISSLTHFRLPDTSNTPFFKSRHHEELLTTRPDSTLHLNTSITTPDTNILPSWLFNVIGSDLGASVLSSKFNCLQVQERERLNQALTRHCQATPSPETPYFSAGVELGRKNRYKDIFPYEHSRVKIQKYDAEDNELDQEESYINASYLHYPGSENQYIATQGPLEETIGDFWKVAYDHKIPLILSLTAQRENEVEKCAPYWEPGTYSSNGVFINVEILEQVDNFKLTEESSCECCARWIRLKIGDRPTHDVLQIQILSWPDYGALISSKDLISLAFLKRHILEESGTCDVPTIVHCSAGCGRTGCFSAIDVVIDLMLSNVEQDDEKDLAYDVISEFRSQRVSMVQNLRQYILIYDTILMFRKSQASSEYNGNNNNWIEDKYDIFNHFIEEKKSENKGN